MFVKLNRTNYFGLGIIIAPPSKEYKGNICINILLWEINIGWAK